MNIFKRAFMVKVEPEQYKRESKERTQNLKKENDLTEKLNNIELKIKELNDYLENNLRVKIKAEEERQALIRLRIEKLKNK